jgi:hypothetical protein
MALTHWIYSCCGMASWMCVETIAEIGKQSGIVVVSPQAGEMTTTAHASAHDLRRGVAFRLVNAGVSAETLNCSCGTMTFRLRKSSMAPGARRPARSAAEIAAKVSSPKQGR